jgi:hypothetical protein
MRIGATFPLSRRVEGSFAMCSDGACPLTFESLLNDPLVRAVMEADGVTPAELRSVMEKARNVVLARQTHVFSVPAERISATSAQA